MADLALGGLELADRVQVEAEEDARHVVDAAPVDEAHVVDDAVAKSAARKLVSGAINAAKASALADDTLVASLRICTLDGVATTDDDTDVLLSKLAALSVCAAL